MQDKKQLVKPRTLSGFMELLPEKQILFNQMKQIIQSTYEKFGFLPLDTPIIEAAEVLLAKAGGETEKQIYRFQKGENDLALRFDLTVPLAKYVAAHQSEIGFPFRRYQIGKVYRGERAQAGRFREFYQCDIDVIGEGELSLIYDAELPAVIYEIFKQFQLGDFKIHINNRKLLNGLLEELELNDKATQVLRIIDKIDKIGKEAVIEELGEIGIDYTKTNQMIEFITMQGNMEETLSFLEKRNSTNELFLQGMEELKQVVEKVKIFGVPEKNYCIDLKIARGLDYYTGTVYETFLDDYRKLGSVCSGGRYEDLAGYYTTQKLPGVGISIGLTRLFYKLNELNLIQVNQKSIAKVLILPASQQETQKCLALGTKLRENKINTEVYLNEKKLKTKLKYADRLQVPYIVILGEEEVQKEIVTLKNMQTGEQKQLTEEELIDVLK